MRKIAALTLLLLLTFPAVQADQASVADKPSIATTQTIKLTAQVLAIDHETRQVTLQGPQGNVRTIQLDKEARRLDEIEAGDTVYAEYVQHLSIEVVAGDGAKPGSGSMSTLKRAPDSELPGVVTTETTLSMATVEEINLENGTFKLNWGEDGIKAYSARDPENLKKADVGDLVLVTYTEALALSVQEVPPQSPE